MGIEYEINDTKITKIASTFNVDKKTVETLYQDYLNFSPRIRHQYLAHIMRSLENYFRNKLKNNRFIVICEPYKHYTVGQKEASADYYQGNKFVIYYNNALPDIKKRDYIAHEVGHLFWLARLDAVNKNKRKQMYEGSTEPLSSIFGIFAMSEKNDFYDNYDHLKENHTNWQQILDFFDAIQKGTPF